MSTAQTSPVPAEPEETAAEAVVVIPGLDHDVEAIYVAPNWKLVWWRFKKHRLALASGVVLILITLVALVPDFFSTQQPHVTNAAEQFIPPQRIHLLNQVSFAQSANRR